MTTGLLMASTALALISGAALAEMNFNRIASFPVTANMADGEYAARESSPEIVDVTADGMTLVYTDSPLGAIGRVDITDPGNPAPLGNVMLDGEPTAVAVIGATAYVGVNTSESYVAPSGKIISMDVASGEITGECDLGGQPDSVAKSKDGGFIAIAIENERDEDLGDGGLPQMPAGSLVMVNVADSMLACDTLTHVTMTGLADVAGEDPEPEFVDINGLGETIVTMQENNYLVIVAADGSIVNHFSAGAVDLTEIDVLDERGALIFDGEQLGRLREPDSVKWLDDDHFATANEGDWHGGSRSWTIFNKDGSVVYEAGNTFEHALVQIGHYPDKRSDAKGVEPESVTFGVFGETPMAFVGSERGSAVGVYDVTDMAAPQLLQLLPSGVGPEGYVTIPERNLLISANEKDLIEDGGARAHVMIFEYQDAPASYPHLTSEGADELIGWGAISGMVADEGGVVWAVSDSFYGYQPRIFKIDTTTTPARIVDAIDVTRAGRPAQKLDLEGIALDGDGGFWLASEGRTDRLVPHALYHVGADGEIEDEIGLPMELEAVKKRFGFEGITMIGDTLWMAVQREWSDDPENHVKLVGYNTETEEWGAVRYQKTAPDYGWVGLSEITAHGDWVYLIERDNQLGEKAVTKLITRVPASEMVAAPLGGDLPVVSREVVRDLLPDLTATGGFVLDKVEGLAIAADGTAWVSTDNDGVDDHSGETMFFSVGTLD